MSRRTIHVPTTTIPKPTHVDSTYGPLAVTAAVGGVGWSVTHLPTGWAVRQGTTRTLARRLASLLHAHPYWTALAKGEEAIALAKTFPGFADDLRAILDAFDRADRKVHPKHAKRVDA